MKVNINLLPTPELIGRRDTGGGAWTVDHCEARRGDPRTDLINRVMNAPSNDDELARVIRAHELMHSKISPANEWPKWIERKVATSRSLKAVEELRVNYLCQKAGFAMNEFLADGSEMADGERIGLLKDWPLAVTMTFATASSKANKAFLNGVRRHNRVWGDALLDISKRAIKEMKKADKHGGLASTDEDSKSKLAPLGFTHTERLAEWLDRLIDADPKDIEKEYGDKREEKKQKKAEKDAKSSSTTDASESEGVHSNKHGDDDGDETKGRMSGTPITNITPSSPNDKAINWTELRVKRLPMPKLTKGNIGKKRVASNVGLRPRRMHRIVTDPEMRIFDRVTRGRGGVVIIDASGSMNFTHEQIRNIVENAPGALVALYTDRAGSGTNMFIVADKGRMVSELPETGFGNGVDFPALVWGVKHRQRHNSPMIWVTDGGVCAGNSGFSNISAMQCLTYCKKNRIAIVPYIEDAIAQLGNLRKGNKVKSIYPSMLKHTYKELMGHELRND